MSASVSRDHVSPKQVPSFDVEKTARAQPIPRIENLSVETGIWKEFIKL